MFVCICVRMCGCDVRRLKFTNSQNKMHKHNTHTHTTHTHVHTQHTHTHSKVPCLKKGDKQSRMQRKIDRMRTKMDVQSRQINYLRIKLGYTLAELRLYKRLKEEMGSQVDQLQAQISLSQEQYRQCLLRLQQAGIGFNSS